MWNRAQHELTQLIEDLPLDELQARIQDAMPLLPSSQIRSMKNYLKIRMDAEVEFDTSAVAEIQEQFNKLFGTTGDIGTTVNTLRRMIKSGDWVWVD